MYIFKNRIKFKLLYRIRFNITIKRMIMNVFRSGTRKNKRINSTILFILLIIGSYSFLNKKNISEIETNEFFEIESKNSAESIESNHQSGSNLKPPTREDQTAISQSNRDSNVLDNDRKIQTDLKTNKNTNLSINNSPQGFNSNNDNKLNLTYDTSKFETFFVPSKNKTVIKPKDFVCPASTINMKINEQKEYSYNPTQKEIYVFQANLDRQKAFILNIDKILQYSRIKFKRVTININVLNLNAPAMIIYECYQDYLESKKMKSFDDFIKTNKIGIMIFSRNNSESQDVEFTECQLNEDKFLENVLYMTKFNTQPFEIKKKLKFNKEFNSMFFSKETSKSILKCNNQEILYVNIIDDIKHVFISIATIDDIWLLKSLFIDSIRYLTNGEIDIGLKRYVQIDIDDIFVTKMVPEDVFELVKLQDDISSKYFQNNQHEFKFVIGFCGKLYQNRNGSENEGDRSIIGLFFSNIID
jgi:hypothetical protein